MSDDTWGKRSGTTSENSINDPSTGFEGGDEKWGGSGDGVGDETHAETALEGAMVSEPTHSQAASGPEPMGRLIAALIGGLIGFVASFLLGLIPFFGLLLGPFGTMGGGVVAGYL